MQIADTCCRWKSARCDQGQGDGVSSPVAHVWSPKPLECVPHTGQEDLSAPALAQENMRHRDIGPKAVPVLQGISPTCSTAATNRP